MFKSLRFGNFLSFAVDAPAVELGPLNVLIGPNGCGKSNFILGIGLIRALAKGNLDEYLRQEGGVSTFVHSFVGAGKIAVEMNLIDACNTPIFYNGKIGFFQEIELIYEEMIGYDGIKNEKEFPITSELHGFRFVDHSLLDKSIKIYKNRVFGREMKPRWPQAADLPNDYLSEDYANLGLILSRIRQKPMARRKLVEWMQVFDPAVTDYNVLIVGGVCQIFLEEGERMVPAGRLSDGALQYLCLLAILCDPDPPPLVCIEEPEIGLHPDVVARLGDLLREAATRTQIIITTHSEALVDAFSDTPECVITCEKRDGSTVMTRLNAEELREWLQEYSLGQLWARGHIGGNKWSA